MKQTRYLDIAKRLASLPKDKQQIFRDKLEQQGINSWQLPIVPMLADTEKTSSESVTKGRGLSLAQQRFLVAEQMSTRALYNLCSVLCFDEGLNVNALEQAVAALIQRHEVLRTRYPMDEKGQWLPELMPSAPISIRTEAKILANKTEQEAWYQREYERQLAEPFDLEAGLPLRIQCYQATRLDTEQRHYWLFFTIHHVAFDAWSSQQLNQELTLLYSAACHSEEKAVLPDLPIQYSDYAHWQTLWREGKDFQRQCEYWKQQLSDIPKTLALPYDRMRKPDHERSYEGAVQCLNVSANLTDQIRQAVNQTNSTLYIYLQTAFSWLLSRYSQQTDFCFGSSIANRSREELRPLVGPLLNTLVLRQTLDGNPSFLESLARTQSVTAGAFDHQDLPFEQVQALHKSVSEQADNQSSETSGALFQVMFVHVALPESQRIRLAGTQVDIIEPKQRHARFDLTLRVVEPNEGGIRLELEHSRELFDTATIDRLLTHLKAVLEQTLVTPQMRLSEVTFSSGLSGQQGAPLVNTAQLMNDRVGHWSTMSRNALDTGEQTISYFQLNRVVDRLASQLIEQGVEKGERVAILMPREARQIACLLACWRIGAVALMLDPRQPEPRLLALMEDAEVALLWQDKQRLSLSAAVPPTCSVVNLPPWATLSNEDGEVESFETQQGAYSERYRSKDKSANDKSTNEASAEDTAYILYTSGSTGKPKGVMVSHGAVAHYAAAISQAVNQSSDEANDKEINTASWLTLATVSADLGLTSVLAALYQGQTLLLPDADLAFDPPALAEFLEAHPADYLKIVPSHLRGLLSVSSPLRLLPKKALISGGEGLDAALFRQLRELSPSMAIINHYGPSETTVGVSYSVLSSDVLASEANFAGLSSVAPLGQALPESTLDVRAEDGQRLPMGATGELWIAGPQLAQGYYSRQSETELNRVFVTDQDGVHYYRSGDRVRLNNQGVYEYLGRLDDQIKRRGYRLSLGEVSGWLQAQDDVHNAYALTWQSDQRALLIAVFESKTNVDDEALLTRMRAGVPDYMVPDHLIRLDSIPLNANGKIDRNAVAADVSESLEKKRSNDTSNAHYDSAANATVSAQGLTANEALLAPLWCSLLNLESVAPDDDFYALGGDSILSLQLIGLARQQGAVLTPLDVMQHRTLKAMAASMPDASENSSVHGKANTHQQVVCDEAESDKQDPVAEVLRDLYREVLARPELDQHADFYRCGGDSILSLQLIARARALNVALSPKLLAEYKTPQALAQALAPDTVKTDHHPHTLDTPSSSLTCVDRASAHPLSDAQKRIWFMQQISPKSSAWNVMQRLVVKPNSDIARLNLEALEAACHAMLGQHEMLRTQFVSQEGQVQQRVMTMEEVGVLPSPMTVHSTRYEDLEALVQDKERRVFDLERGQLWSLDVFCLTDEHVNIETNRTLETNNNSEKRASEYQLLINIHHIATDGWSMGLLVQRFLAFYKQAVAGEDVSISQVTPSYIDWAAKQESLTKSKTQDQVGTEQSITDQALSEQEKVQDNRDAYWQQRLQRMPHTLTLPTDYAYPDVKTDHGARVEVTLPIESVAQLERKAQSLEVTPFQVLFAAWKLLLWRYSGQTDFAVGVPVSGRDDPDCQNMVGVFINTLVCRSQIDASQSVNEWLCATAADTLKDLSEPMPLERLLEQIQPERDMARPALFQTLFNYQADVKGQRSVTLPGLSIEALPQKDVSSKSELSLNVFRQQTLSIQLEYNRDLFASTTADQMLCDYRAIVTQILETAQTSRPLSSVSLPSMQQDQARGPISLIRSEDDFIRRFETQVEDTPNAWALHAMDGSLTYGELNAQANRLAHWLIHSGFVDQPLEGLPLEEQAQKERNREKIVAFCLPRDSRLLIVMLAIQKVGAAYVPLDPTQPKARLELIAQRAGASLCLCDCSTIDALDELKVPGLERVNLDDLRDELSKLPSRNTEIRVPDASLAYTLYTSGSTGVPKGVQLERRQFANFLRAMERILPPFNHVLALTTITFDIAGLELCLPLVKGASVVLANDEARRDGEQLGELITQFDVDLVQATPSGWRLLEGLPAHALANVTALAGGEALDSDLARKLKDQCRSLINVYGPTETTVWSSSYNVQESNLPLTPIGEPLLNNHCYVLDAQLDPVPRGVVGELYIAGEGVARGYQGRPELTAERFLPDPFGQGGRLYRTGDLVKRLSDGAMYFIGRVDQQVKLRGFRIELGEIEAALAASPLVAQAAVTIEQERLIAWCVQASQVEDAAQSDVFESRIHDFLALTLPEYMLPQGYEWLDTLPLNASGKVDRKALSERPLSESTSIEGDAMDSSSRLDVFSTHERIVYTIWRALLKRDSLQKHDHFFHLGGHSLMAAQVRSRLGEQGFDVPLRTLFERPVLSDLASYLSEHSASLTDQRHTIPVVDRHRNMPLSPAQRRIWFMQQLKPHDVSFNMSSVIQLERTVTEGKADKASNRLDIEALKQAVYAVAQRHEILRVTYHADENGEGYQGVNKDLMPLITVVELDGCSLTSADEVLEARWNDAANTSFDLTKESPLRLTLYRLSKQHWYVQLVLHHIASDGWSMAILANDLIESYQAAVQGKSASLPALPIQYIDYAAWQETPEMQMRQQAGLDYWRRHLVGMPDQLALPMDRPRTKAAGDAGGAVDIQVSESLANALHQFSNQQGCSLFMLLMAAYTSQLHIETGAQDIVMGTDVANRNQAETEELVGFFVNLLALRMKPKATDTFSDYLQQVRQVCLDGLAYQDTPFDRVVETVQPVRVQGSHPLIQALLVMQNTPSAQRDIDGLRVTPHINEQQHSKFDMALFASEDLDEQGKTQLALRWVYRTALFENSTIERLGRDLLALLECIVEQPNMPLLSLKRRVSEQRSQRTSISHNNSIAQDNCQPSSTISAETHSTMETTPPIKRKLSKLSKMKKTKSTSASSPALVEARPLNPDTAFPLLVTCKEPGLDPKAWAEKNQAQIMTWVEKHGGILFRGFNLPTPVAFESFCQGIYPELYGQYGDLPKKEVGKKIYQSTPYPNNQMIMFHNESSHQHRWPRRQWFYCEVAAESGGCTPIVDCRVLYQRLPEKVRQKLQEKQLQYVRNFSGLDVSWQHFFKTEDRSEVEAICRESSIDFEWYDEDKLRISQVCPAVIRHPVTGEMSFFNQLQLHHYSFLEAGVREHFLTVGGEENLPRNVYYGDGEPLEQEVVDLISDLYERYAVRFDWQHGDVVMLDNMLAAHARDPFEGKRKMAVAMGDIYRREQLDDLNSLTEHHTESAKPFTLDHVTTDKKVVEEGA
ncbi:amino acid adenylation domain-containing protein [Marinomonas mediterranea]|uniref:non-ribosomal peptide synthetase n=1 Tax=Marinomonas mediterranea TaxID=119864 RepID=UPI00234B2F7D|nr:non-ribosomal peptide synthetase [Marinomonas mediterranea]WCN12352.1 amino acid adenylation domain-containing protein [Marinomonas mediterranea]